MVDDDKFSARYRGRLGFISEVHPGRAILPKSAQNAPTGKCDSPNHYHNGPLIFRLRNATTGRTSHCAAQGFTAEEGTIVLPQWMLDNLGIADDEEILVQRVCLPLAIFCKLESYDSDVRDLPERKKALEKTLHKLCCITTGDIIKVVSDRYMFDVKVVETQPEEAVNITACDINGMVANVHYRDEVKPRRLNRRTTKKSSPPNLNKTGKNSSDNKTQIANTATKDKTRATSPTPSPPPKPKHQIESKTPKEKTEVKKTDDNNTITPKPTKKKLRKKAVDKPKPKNTSQPDKPESPIKKHKTTSNKSTKNKTSKGNEITTKT